MMKMARRSASRSEARFVSPLFLIQDGSEVYFSMKENTPFKKLFDTYCRKNGIEPGSIKFLIDGDRINEESTPKDLCLEDNDMIEVMHTQIGG